MMIVIFKTLSRPRRTHSISAGAGQLTALPQAPQDFRCPTFNEREGKERGEEKRIEEEERKKGEGTKWDREREDKGNEAPQFTFMATPLCWLQFINI